MPVGTAATVKAIFPDNVKATGADVILSNTYTHAAARGGTHCAAWRPARVHALGSTHPDRPGGYQVMSLSQLRTVTERGVPSGPTSMAPRTS